MTTTPATCSTDSCTNPVKVRGLCQRCYMRGYRNGSVKATYQKSKTGPACTIEGCDNRVHARGLCHKHIARAARHGDPNAPVQVYRRNKGKPCEATDCDRPAIVNGLCGTHDWQQRNKGELNPIGQNLADNSGPCEVSECGRPAHLRGYCRTHYDRRLRGEMQWDRPIKTHAPHGAGHRDAYGYRIISVDGQTVREHRHLIEQLLGRPLLSDENVHHIDGVRDNNTTDGPLRAANGKLRSGNLELWSTSQPAGQEVPAKVAWAREILALYGDLVPEVTA